MDRDTEFVRLPAIRRKQVEQNFLLFLSVMSSHEGVPPPELLSRAVGLENSLVTYAISASLSDLSKFPREHSVKRRAAYRLAANIDRLKKGWPCPPGDVTADTYAAAVIIGLEPQLDAGGSRSFFRVAYRVLSDRAAGSQLIDRFSPSAAKAIYMSLTGWPRKCSPYSPLLLVGLECAVQLKREMGEIKVVSVGVTRSQRTRNAKFTKTRFRVHADCPFGFGVDCADCAIGQSECDRSVYFIDTG